MIHTLIAALLWLLSLFLAFKWGQSTEIVRAIRGTVLNERELQTGSGRARGASRSSSIERGPLAEHPSALHSVENGAPPGSAAAVAPSRSVLYDQESEPANGIVLTLLGRTVKAK